MTPTNYQMSRSATIAIRVATGIPTQVATGMGMAIRTILAKNQVRIILDPMTNLFSYLVGRLSLIKMGR